MGTLQSPMVTVTGRCYPLALALGDVNRNGHLDAIVADESGNFQVLLGRGNGTFSIQALTSFGSSGLDLQPNVFAIADFNSDGKPDLAAGNETYYPQFANGQVCIFDGNGDGTFSGSNSRCFLAPDSYSPMQVTNLNGRPGLAFASYPLYVLTTSAPGNFSEASYSAGGGPIALGDFNGDGRQDVVAANNRGVEVLLNTGATGVLRAPLDVTLSLIGPPKITSINTTDFNGDGFADLAIAENYNDHGFLSPSIGTVLVGGMNRMTPGGIAWPTIREIVQSMSNPPAIGDFNHDGKLDMAYSTIDYDPDFGTVGTLQVVFGDGKGQFPTLGPVLAVLSNFIASGYFNGDGFADLASLYGDDLAILLGKGDGTFASPVNYPVGTNPVFVLQRDLNGDGKRDLVVVNQDSDNLSVLLGNGDGTFKPQKTFASGNLPKWAVTGDLNRDGKIDIAIASKGGISVLLGKGDGTFQPEKTYSATGPVTGIVQASVRQDGIECLLAIDSTSQRFVLLPGIGDGTFGAPVFFPVDRVPTAIVAADFNRDGATDIALLGNGRVVVFYNQGGNYVSLSSSSPMPRTYQLVTLTARVTPGYGEIARVSGNVTFTDGTKVLGTATLQGRIANITAQLTAGTHQIHALYGGNENLNPNHSPTLILVAE